MNEEEQKQDELPPEIRRSAEQEAWEAGEAEWIVKETLAMVIVCNSNLMTLIQHKNWKSLLLDKVRIP